MLRVFFLFAKDCVHIYKKFIRRFWCGIVLFKSMDFLTIRGSAFFDCVLKWSKLARFYFINISFSTLFAIATQYIYKARGSFELKTLQRNG